MDMAGLPSAACANLMNAASFGSACVALAMKGEVNRAGCGMDQRESLGP